MEPFTHTRPDGATVRLTGPRWRLEVRDAAGRLTEQPQEWLVEHASGARLVTLRKAAEPLRWTPGLADDVRAAADAMARLKPGEREAVEQALRDGRPIALKVLLRGFDGRRLKSNRGLVGQGTADTRALCDRVAHAEKTAVAELDPALAARLDAWIAEAKAN